ncbi:hypothetical protein AB0M36_35405 [Actinoplanes sp. NPDC051346]|uniref:hypothetical protein n=1 Tax=Actinoplanes sp. NPDC051346 TaxID=3155048 RepID=UPI0034379B0B
MGNEITALLSTAMVLTAVTAWVWIIARTRQRRIISTMQHYVIKQNEVQHAVLQHRMDEAMHSISNIERLLMDAD